MKFKISTYRKTAAQSQKWRCYYCELPMGGEGSPYAKAVPLEKKRLLATAEHLHARQDGGKDSRANIVAAHDVCNKCRHNAKRAKSPAEFSTFVKSRVAKNKWFNVDELKLLFSAESYVAQGNGNSRGPSR